jgi:hypothetical protein
MLGYLETKIGHVTESDIIHPINYAVEKPLSYQSLS